MAKRKEMSLVVISPDRQILAETADSVVIPAHDGELGILAGRAPLMCELGVGQLRYRKGQETHRLVLDGGFAQVLRDGVTVLTNSATAEDAISADAVAAAERAAQEAGDDAAGRDLRRRARQRASVLRRVLAQR